MMYIRTHILHIALVLLQILQTRLVRASETDVLIVGAGNAGCVVAARLCANLPNLHITLAERANPRSEQEEFTVRAPANTVDSWLDPSVSENFMSEPETYLLNRTMVLSVGATLGGSTATNAMQWVAPLAGDVRKWRVAGLNERNADIYLGRVLDQVGFAAQKGEFRQRYVDDLLQAGYRAGFVPDSGPFDRNVSLSLFENRVAIDSKGRRVDSCTAYLSPVLNSTCARNLQLLQGVTVTKVLFHRRRWWQRKLRAYGVEYVRSNDTSARHRMTIHARKRVILSSGSFGSPKLLQLSGIGPRSVLRKLGIPVLKNLPVGSRTQARSNVGITSSYKLPLEPLDNISFVRAEGPLQRWKAGDGGPLGAGICSVNARVHQDGYMVGAFISPALFVPPEAPNDSRLFTTFCFNNPTSRGWMRIRDTNPFSSPLVKLGLYSGRNDLKRMLRCLENTRRIHRSFEQRFDMRPVAPEDGLITARYILESTHVAFHFVSGCAVDFVLDRRLRVKGTRGLHVVDSSAFRRMPTSAGPMASTYMLAEFMSEQLIAGLRFYDRGYRRWFRCFKNLHVCRLWDRVVSIYSKGSTLNRIADTGTT